MLISMPLDQVVDHDTYIDSAAIRKDEKIVGVCKNGNMGREVDIGPITDAESYLRNFNGRSVDLSGAKITVSSAPKYGSVAYIDDPIALRNGFMKYVADVNEYTPDSFLIRVEKNGVRVDVVYTIYMLDENEPGGDLYCKKDLWKISSIADGTNFSLPLDFGQSGFGPNYSSIKYSIKIVSGQARFGSRRVEKQSVSVEW